MLKQKRFKVEICICLVCIRINIWNDLYIIWSFFGNDNEAQTYILMYTTQTLYH